MRIRDEAIKRYIRLNKSIRSVTDPLVKNRGAAQEIIDRRGAKGRQIVKNRIKMVFGGKKRK
jgi:hypothetical protein